MLRLPWRSAHASAASGPAAPRRSFPNVHRLRVEMKLGYWRTSLWYWTHIVVRQRTIIPNARMKNSAPVCGGEMI